MAPRAQTSRRPTSRRSPRGRTANRSAPAKRTARSTTKRSADRYAGFKGETDSGQLDELLLEALETELGGILVYEAALRCARNEDLRREWGKYLDQTRNHERVLTGVFQKRGLDVMADSQGRRVVRGLGQGLVEAMETALANASPEAAELVAAECVVLAETKDHANWELLGEAAKAVRDAEFARVLREACDEVEDEHLYHAMGWSRELWIQSLGLPAALPPPEERKRVKTAIAAARAAQQAKGARKRLLA
jgi:rubrerythrin